MKTLIFNGSPHPNGDTMQLVQLLKEQLPGSVHMVNCYFSRISPCNDCRFCCTHSGCCIPDEMQTVYPRIEEADNILIASPIYFSQPTGQLLSVASRLQTYFSAWFFRKELPAFPPKKGGVILTGGGSLSPVAAFETACILLKEMHVTQIAPLVCSHKTDRLPAISDMEAREGIRQMAAFFSEENTNNQRRLEE